MGDELSRLSAMGINAGKLASMIDHTFLKAAGEPDAVAKLCDEAKEYGFIVAMVNPAEVKKAVMLLKGSSVRVGTVIGFPLGQNTAKIKVAEAQDAIENGAKDIDYVINVRLLKAACGGCPEAEKVLKDELMALASVKASAFDLVTKLIIETCYLTDEEKVYASLAAKEAGFDFVKTSTGFGTGGATVHDVALMRKTVGYEMGVKASGGIRDVETALALIEAGATRLGCSAGIDIIRSLNYNKRILSNLF